MLRLHNTVAENTPRLTKFLQTKPTTKFKNFSRTFKGSEFAGSNASTFKDFQAVTLNNALDYRTNVNIGLSGNGLSD